MPSFTIRKCGRWIVRMMRPRWRSRRLIPCGFVILESYFCSSVLPYISSVRFAGGSCCYSRISTVRTAAADHVRANKPCSGGISVTTELRSYGRFVDRLKSSVEAPHAPLKDWVCNGLQ